VAEKATTAERGGRVPSGTLPRPDSDESRGRLSNVAAGHSRSIIGRMVAAPRNQVSSLPRACSTRSVKTWPRSRCPASWTSSTARKLTATSGMASTVHTQYRGRGGTRFSSPVTSATAPSPTRAVTRS
jgi:hypothetical protein